MRAQGAAQDMRGRIIEKYQERIAALEAQNAALRTALTHARTWVDPHNPLIQDIDSALSPTEPT